MGAEDFDNVPGLGDGRSAYHGGNYGKKQYKCNFCHENIHFQNRKAMNMDGSAHRCMPKSADAEKPKQQPPQQATLFAMAAMNAIINAQIQVGGVDHIHRMNFYDVADASWRIASAMIAKEKTYSEDF